MWAHGVNQFFVFFHDMFEHDEDGVAENDGEW